MELNTKDLLNEECRLQELQRFAILDTPPELLFDQVAEFLGKFFDVPVAMVNFIDRDRVWFKSNRGFEGQTESSRASSICSLTLFHEGVTIFEDAKQEPALANSPVVHPNLDSNNDIGEDTGLSFYAGAPLITSEGFHIGSICICDAKPRQFETRQYEVLEAQAKIVMAALNDRLSRHSQEQAHESSLQQTQNFLAGEANKISAEGSTPDVKVCAWTGLVFQDGEWKSVASYLRDTLQLNVTHGMCPEEYERQRSIALKEQQKAQDSKES